VSTEHYIHTHYKHALTNLSNVYLFQFEIYWKSRRGSWNTVCRWAKCSRRFEGSKLLDIQGQVVEKGLFDSEYAGTTVLWNVGTTSPMTSVTFQKACALRNIAVANVNCFLSCEHNIELRWNVCRWGLLRVRCRTELRLVTSAVQDWTEACYECGAGLNWGLLRVRCKTELRLITSAVQDWTVDGEGRQAALSAFCRLQWEILPTRQVTYSIIPSKLHQIQPFTTHFCTYYFRVPSVSRVTFTNILTILIVTQNVEIKIFR
jgi:hypothetical protein